MNGESKVWFALSQNEVCTDLVHFFTLECWSQSCYHQPLSRSTPVWRSILSWQCCNNDKRLWFWGNLDFSQTEMTEMLLLPPRGCYTEAQLLLKQWVAALVLVFFPSKGVVIFVIFNSSAMSHGYVLTVGKTKKLKIYFSWEGIPPMSIY